MSAFKDRTGIEYGRLTAIKPLYSKPGLGWVWLCECNCKTENKNTKEVSGNKLEVGDTRSCGCLYDETRETCNRTHGMSDSPEYGSYRKMLTRCCNPNCDEYPDYGGRGIKVCDRWLESFENFHADMGNMSPGCDTIERPDCNGNYCPGNAIWAPRCVQNNNKRNSHYETHNGVTQTVADWARELETTPSAIRYRLKKFKGDFAAVVADLEAMSELPTGENKLGKWSWGGRDDWSIAALAKHVGVIDTTLRRNLNKPGVTVEEAIRLSRRKPGRPKATG